MKLFLVKRIFFYLNNFEIVDGIRSKGVRILVYITRVYMSVLSRVVVKVVKVDEIF